MIGSQQLADALDSAFLREVLGEELHYARIEEVLHRERRASYDIEVDELPHFVADGVVVHNCAPPFRQAEFDIMYGKGISREGSLLDVGVDLGIVKKSGAWFTYEGEQLGQGRENVKTFLAENVDLMVEISEKIKAASGINDVENRARRSRGTGRRRRRAVNAPPAVTTANGPVMSPAPRDDGAVARPFSAEPA